MTSPRQQPVRSCDQDAISTGRHKAAATNVNGPQEAQNIGLSMSEVSSRTGIRSELELTTIYPRLRIAVAFALPTSFPVHIRTISPYVLI